MTDGDTRDNWQVQTLRLTLFTSGLWSGNATIWHDLTGKEPDVDENRSREGIRHQIGSESEGQLETVVTAARTDVVIFPSPPVQGVLPVTYFGPAREKIRNFVSLVMPWLRGVAETGTIIRLAFGAVLLLPVENREAGYRELDRLLRSVKVDPANSREIFYRINRPKIYGENIELNRITTWSTLDVRKFINLSPSAVQPSPPVTEEKFVRLEVDHSTPADRAEPLPSDEIVPILKMLKKMAVENATSGEQP